MMWVTMVVGWLVAFGTAIWMAVDSKRLGYDKRDIRGMAAMTPVGWFFSGMLFWLIAFPLYISRRPQLREAGRRRGDAQMSGVPLPRPSNGLFLGGIVGCLCFGALLCLPLLAEAASPKLPECASSDVTTIGNQLLTETPALKAFEIAADWHTAGEVRMRSEPPRRICRVMIKSAAGSEAIYYAVEWQQKENKIIFVQLLGAADDGR